MTASRHNLQRRVAKLEAAREQRQEFRSWVVEYEPGEQPVLQLEGNEPLPRPGVDGAILVLPANYRRYRGPHTGTWKNGRYIPPGSGPAYYLDRDPDIVECAFLLDK